MVTNNNKIKKRSIQNHRISSDESRTQNNFAILAESNSAPVGNIRHVQAKSGFLAIITTTTTTTITTITTTITTITTTTIITTTTTTTTTTPLPPTYPTCS